MSFTRARCKAVKALVGNFRLMPGKMWDLKGTAYIYGQVGDNESNYVSCW